MSVVKCEKCNAGIKSTDDVFPHLGQSLCEDCYIDAVSPPKACDPWAVHIAKSSMSAGSVLSGVQKKILAEVGSTDGVEPGEIAERLGMKPADVDRELATLRHMEKIKGALRGGKKVVLPW